jgi:hypothetical protein
MSQPDFAKLIVNNLKSKLNDNKKLHINKKNAKKINTKRSCTGCILQKLLQYIRQANEN